MAPRPLQLGADTNWVRIACGNEVGAGVKADGTLWTWGSRGTGVKLPEASITPLELGIDHDWSDVSVDGLGFGTEGTMHAIKSDGTLWTWDPQILAAKGTPPAAGLVSNAVPHRILRLREVSKDP
jgi:hypothetical protein